MDLDELEVKIEQARQIGAVKVQVSDDYDIEFCSNDRVVLSIPGDILQPE